MGPAFFTSLLAVFTVIVAGSAYLVTLGGRVALFRSVFSRLCLQLRLDQSDNRPQTKFPAFNSLLHPATKTITALEFLELEQGRVSVIDKIDELALSLFAGRVMRLLVFAHLVGSAVSAALAAVIFLLIPETEAKGHIDSWPAVSMVAATLGASASFLVSIVYWHVSFQRSLVEIDQVAERHPLWSPGVTRSTLGRELLKADDDSSYKVLKKLS